MLCRFWVRRLPIDDRDHHQQTLVDELNHRAKNTLTAIQAIAHQTYRQSKSWENFEIILNIGLWQWRGLSTC